MTTVLDLPPQVAAKITEGPAPAHRPDLGPHWCWTGAVGASGKGYGLLTIKRKVWRAHVIVYVTLVGPVPVGRELDHVCLLTTCVNPAHLEPVTHRENMRRHFAAALTCKNGHEWTEENTWRSPSHGRRQCRACNGEKQRAAR